MKIAEKILKSHFFEKESGFGYDTLHKMHKTQILKAMEEYAQQKVKSNVSENKNQIPCLNTVIQNILNYLFPKKSKWVDIYMFEDNGRYKLIQMRHRLDNNKKEFRIASIGYINDNTVKSKIYENILK